MSRSKLEWNETQVLGFLEDEFPQIFEGEQQYQISELKEGFLVLTLDANGKHLRPGDSISGPTQLEMADFAVYFLLLAHHGEKARLSVTTNLNCSFLRKPGKGKLTCQVMMIKHGRTLSVAEVKIFGADGKLAANLELTYFTGCVYQ